MNDRMFHVLVLGGIALVGCGGGTSDLGAEGARDAAPSDAGSEDGGAHVPHDAGSGVFPSELASTPLPAFDAASPDAGGSDAGEAGDAGDAGDYADAQLPDASLCLPCEAK